MHKTTLLRKIFITKSYLGGKSILNSYNLSLQASNSLSYLFSCNKYTHNNNNDKGKNLEFDMYIVRVYTKNKYKKV